MKVNKLALLDTDRKLNKIITYKGVGLEIYHRPLTTKAYGQSIDIFIVDYQILISGGKKINDFYLNTNNKVRFKLNQSGEILNIVEYQMLITTICAKALYQEGCLSGKNESFKENLDWWVERHGRRAMGYTTFRKDNPWKKLTRNENPITVEPKTFTETKVIETIIEPEIMETIAEVVETTPEFKTETKKVRKTQNKLVPNILDIKKFIKTNRRQLKVA